MFLFISIISIITIIILYNYSNYEGFTNKIDYNFYNKHIFNLKKYITKNENTFINKWINNLERKDFSMNNISTYLTGVTIYTNGTVNYSRFAIGTLTKFYLFKTDCIDLMKKMHLNPINVPNNYMYYGVAWDIHDNLFKIYLLNNKRTNILCYVYKITRHNNDIINSNFLQIKKYDVYYNNTIMHKNGQRVYQINSNTLSKNLLNKYEKAYKIINKMKKFNWMLDTYSEYDNKLNLYFEEPLE